MQLFLFDSDIIIDYLKGFDDALKYFESFDLNFSTSVVTIAATAKAHGATLVSLNVRHFSMLDNVLIPYER